MKRFFTAALVLGYFVLVPSCIAAPAPAYSMDAHGTCPTHEVTHHFEVYESVSTASPTVHFHVETVSATTPTPVFADSAVITPPLSVHFVRSDSHIRKKDAAWIALRELSPPVRG